MISCPIFEKQIGKIGESACAETPTADFAALFAASPENVFQNNAEAEKTGSVPDDFQTETALQTAETKASVTENKTPQIFVADRTKSNLQPLDQNVLFDKTDPTVKNDAEINLLKAVTEIVSPEKSEAAEPVENFDFPPLDSSEMIDGQRQETPVALPKTSTVQTEEKAFDFSALQIEPENEQIKNQTLEENVEAVEFSDDLPGFLTAMANVFKQADNFPTSNITPQNLPENNLTIQPETLANDLENQPIFRKATLINQESPLSFPETPDARAEINSALLVRQSNEDAGTQEIFQTESETVFYGETEMLIKRGIENGLVEIFNRPDAIKNKTLTPEIISESEILRTQKNEEFPDNLPGFLTAMANVFKQEISAEQAENAGFSVDFALNGNIPGEAQSVTAVAAPDFAGSGMNDLNKKENTLPEAEKLTMRTEEVSAINFDQFAAVSTKENSAENNAPMPFKSQEVMTQIEPQILYLASLAVRESEKKTMKMRLHPAELGMVEITLERDVSGNLNAHFQTESEATRQILTENINDLRQTLENSGWQIEQMEITCAAFSASEKNDSDGRGRQTSEFQPAENQTEAASFADKTDGETDDRNDFRRNRSSGFVSLRA